MTRMSFFVAVLALFAAVSFTITIVANVIALFVLGIAFAIKIYLAVLMAVLLVAAIFSVAYYPFVKKTDDQMYR